MANNKNIGFWFGAAVLFLGLICLLVIYFKNNDRFIFSCFFSLLCGIGFGVIGGTAKARGKFFDQFSPITFGLTGGSAFLVIVFFYAKITMSRNQQ